MLQVQQCGKILWPHLWLLHRQTLCVPAKLLTKGPAQHSTLVKETESVHQFADKHPQVALKRHQVAWEVYRAFT